MLYSAEKVDVLIAGRVITTEVTKTVWMLACIPEQVFHKYEVTLVFISIN
jgi:hypothetical protein